MATGTLFVVAAPSGAGKTSLVNALVAEMPRTKLSISHTTRPKRKAEIHGEHYHFVDHKTFETKLADGEFLEHATVFGNYYGTSRQWVEAELAAGFDVILEIDWQGAEQIKALMPDSLSIFILPPSSEILLSRLKKRDQDHPEVISDRMSQAASEMSHYADFDYLVVNDDFDQAQRELQAIVLASRLRCTPQSAKHQGILENLLKGG